MVKRAFFIAVFIGAAAVSCLCAAADDTPDAAPGAPYIYDATYILCCGTELTGEPFCTNLARSDCETYNGRSVQDCSQCKGVEMQRLGRRTPRGGGMKSTPQTR